MVELTPLWGYSPYAWVSLSLLFVLGIMLGVLWTAWWLMQPKYSLCPYTRTPLRHTIDLPTSSLIKIYRFLQSFPGYDNRVFKLKNSAFCRDTGRIFPNAINWLGKIKKVDWTFLNKRFPGYYVSWGSLSKEQKEEIYSLHHSLEGFQTEYSCPNPSPNKVEPSYVYTKPGPLYVDLNTKILLGWQCVPDSEFEVLIVQKPRDLEKLFQQS